MNLRAVIALLVPALALPPLVTALDTGKPAKPPEAKKVPHKTEIHGRTLVDNYHWLREKDQPAVRAYLEAENLYCDQVMKPHDKFRQAIYDEMLGRVKETDSEAPYREGDYFYYSRTEKGKQYPIHCRKKGSLDEKEEIILDVNELARGKKYASMGTLQVNDDATLLAYTLDSTGNADFRLFIKDLATGKLLDDDVGENVESFVWTDAKTLFFVTEDKAKRPFKARRHVLGRPKAEDSTIIEEKDELFRINVTRTRDRKYLLIGIRSFESGEYWYLPCSDTTRKPELIAERTKNHEYDVHDHHDGSFYILTNDKGRNFRLVSAPVAGPKRDRWKEVMPHTKDIRLAKVLCFADHFVTEEREGGLPRIRVTEWKTGNSRRIEFPEPVYSAGVWVNKEYKTTRLLFQYMSLKTPDSVFEEDMASKKRTLVKRHEVPGYDPDRYESGRLEAKAADGTLIPISTVFKKGFKKDGSAPMLLYGYGAYGAPMDAWFDSKLISLLDRGVIFAVAHVRGGGELGKVWHDQGRLLNKKNTFTDFIACAEHLLAEKYTSKDRLGIYGASAGGLLIGTVLNMRPDLFRVAILRVPFVDAINTMLDETLPLTVPEFEEWGNPKDKKFFEYMHAYSPYDNLAAKAYPAILVKTGLNDPAVMYWEPAKYVAKLRSLKTDDNVLVLNTNLDAGHRGASGRYEALHEKAFEYTFLLSQLGLAKAE